jgi:hypothetical protein
MKSIYLFAIIAFGLFLASPIPVRATSPETTAEETSLMNNAKAFVDAFEKGDAKAVAAFWAEDVADNRPGAAHFQRAGFILLQRNE